jgi:uncharacterized protein
MSSSSSDEYAARAARRLNKRLYVGFSTPGAEGLPPIEVINEHGEYLLELERNGVLFAAGPLLDDDGKLTGEGLYILRASSRSEAEEILRQDPLFADGSRTLTVHGWELHEGTIGVRVKLSDSSYSLD